MFSGWNIMSMLACSLYRVAGEPPASEEEKRNEVWKDDRMLSKRRNVHFKGQNKGRDTQKTHTHTHI